MLEIIFGATGNCYSWLLCWWYTGPVSTIDRIDYSNDTATAVAKGPLSLARNMLAGAGNASFGYFGGGFSVQQYQQ